MRHSVPIPYPSRKHLLVVVTSILLCYTVTMNRNDLLALSERFLQLPTAPYHEHAIQQAVLDVCARLNVPAQSDPAGNIIARCESGPIRNRPPLVFVAHMDHPGFEVTGTDRAEFLGNVVPPMFDQTRFRIYTRQGAQRAHIQSVIQKKTLTIIPLDNQPVRWQRGDFGQWDLPPFRVQGDRLHAPAIDDVLGVTVNLATLTNLVESRARTRAWFVFTRAEEVGFHGAIELVRRRIIPMNAAIISIEMSKQRPWAKMDNGPVIRVGDRLATFDSDIVYFLQTVAFNYRQHHPQFKYQRALMDGGACEASAFIAHGYKAAGLCLPLGNYHNIGPDQKPRAEFVSVNDLEHLVKLTTESARSWPQSDRICHDLKHRIELIRKSAPRSLPGGKTFALVSPRARCGNYTARQSNL